MYCRVSCAIGMSSTSRLCLRIRYSSRSSGPWNDSSTTSSASGGMYRSCGISIIGSPWTCATGLAGCVWSCTSVSLMVSVVAQPHRLAHVAHGLGGQLACLLATVGDDVLHQARVVEVHLCAFAHRLLFFQHRCDDGLFAFDAADARAAATLLHPLFGFFAGIYLMQLPHRTLVRVARIGAADACRVGGHGADLPGHLGLVLAQADGVAVGLGHLVAVQAR